MLATKTNHLTSSASPVNSTEKDSKNCQLSHLQAEYVNKLQLLQLAEAR
jgi:hypothetical protein